MDEARKRKDGYPVRCVETNKIFFSAKEAAMYYNLDNSTISKICRKNLKNSTCGGYHWEYVNDFNRKRF